jgi:diphthamide biosynthesis enzyme Dph1/Dph2-like protein
MKQNRKSQIDKSLSPMKKIDGKNSINYGLILSTLGRQGSPKILDNLINKLTSLNKNYFIILMSEIFPDKLKMFKEQIDTYA